MSCVLQILVASASIIILCHSEPVINRMDQRTGIAPRAAFLLLAVGAVVRLYDLYTGATPSPATVITTAGLALLLIFDRRRPALAPTEHTKDAR